MSKRNGNQISNPENSMYCIQKFTQIGNEHMLLRADPMQKSEGTKAPFILQGF